MAGTGIYGQILRAQLENAAADLTPTAIGLLYYNTTSNIVKWYTGGAWKTALDTDSAQDVSGKTLIFGGAGSCFFKHNVGVDKKLSFDMSGSSNSTTTTLATTSTTSRTINLPDADGDLPLLPVGNGVLYRSGGSPTMVAEAQLAVTRGGTGQSTANAAFGALSPMTTDGDLITRAGGVPSRLAVGATGQVLTVAAGAPAWGDASAGGSGEINVVTNPSASSATTGWTAGTGHTVSRITSGSPLDPTIDTALELDTSLTPPTAAAESSTSGVYWSIATMPASLTNKKLKVEFYVTVPSSDAWRLSVYAGATRLALSTDSSSVTTLPAGFIGKFTAYFDTTSATAYSVNFTKTTNSGTNKLKITSVIVGPGIQPQGAVVGPTYYGQNLTLNNMPAVVVNNWTYQRVGDSLQLSGDVQFSADGVSGSEVSFTLPSGLTTTTTRFVVGVAEYFTTGDGRPAPLEGEGVSGDQGKVRLFSTGFTAGIIGTETGISSGRITNMYFNALIPVNEWSGSGTVNVAQNDVTYIADDGSADVFGADGALVPNVGFGTATTTRSVAFSDAQASDSYQVEYKRAGGQWQKASDLYPFFSGNNANTSNFYGIRGSWASATQYDIEFGNQGIRVSSTTADNGASAWSVRFTAGDRFRLVRAKSGQAVGFGMASATTLGLVSGGTVPGKVDGASVAAGYLGEVLTASVTTTTVTTTESDVTGATFALSAGVWLVQFSATIRIATGSTVGNEHAIGVYLTNAANTRQGLDKTLALKTPASGQLDVTTALSGIILLNIASATTYKLRAKLTNFTGTAAAAQIVSAAENYTNFQATRIA